MSVSAELLAGLVAELADALAPKVAAELAARMGPATLPEPWRLVGVDQVAVALGRSRRWVHGAVKERGLPVVRLDGGALAFDLDAVREWALARQVPAAEGETLAARLQAPRNGAQRAVSAGRDRTAMQKAGRQ